MKQLITYCFLVITVPVFSQSNSKDSLKGTWYISMIGVNINDTAIYKVMDGKSEIRFGDLMEQKLTHPRFYTRNPKPYYVSYGNIIDHQGSLYLYQTKKARRKGSEPLILEYVLEKDLLILIEPETSGISTEFGLPVYDKLTVLTRFYDSQHWNKQILGSWNYDSSKPFFDLKPGDTCRFTKAGFQEDNQLRFDLNSGFTNCTIKENPAKPSPAVQSNGVLDGVYLRDKWYSYRYSIDLEKKQLTFLIGSSEMTFKISELTNGSLVLVKQIFQPSNQLNSE